MKLFWKKYKDVLLIYKSALLIGLFLYIIFCHKTELLIAPIATGISLALGLRQYRIENDKIFKELFISFNDKYDTKFKDELIKIESEYQKDNNYNLT